MRSPTADKASALRTEINGELPLAVPPFKDDMSLFISAYVRAAPISARLFDGAPKYFLEESASLGDCVSGRRFAIVSVPICLIPGNFAKSLVERLEQRFVRGSRSGSDSTKESNSMRPTGSRPARCQLHRACI